MASDTRSTDSSDSNSHQNHFSDATNSYKQHQIPVPSLHESVPSPSRKSLEVKDQYDTSIITEGTKDGYESQDWETLLYTYKEPEPSAVPFEYLSVEQISVTPRLKKNYLIGKKPSNLRQTCARLYFPFLAQALGIPPANYKNRLKGLQIDGMIEGVIAPLGSRETCFDVLTDLIPINDFRRWRLLGRSGSAQSTYSNRFWQEFLGKENVRSSYFFFIDCLWTLVPEDICLLFGVLHRDDDVPEMSDLDGLLSILRFESCWSPRTSPPYPTLH